MSAKAPYSPLASTPVPGDNVFMTIWEASVWQQYLVRMFMEERASFSPDAMIGMEANLRFAGPETMESKIFGRLTAWQNWIFQRPNSVGATGALTLYGSGSRPKYDFKRA